MGKKLYRNLMLQNLEAIFNLYLVQNDWRHIKMNLGVLFLEDFGLVARGCL